MFPDFDLPRIVGDMFCIDKPIHNPLHNQYGPMQPGGSHPHIKKLVHVKGRMFQLKIYRTLLIRSKYKGRAWNCGMHLSVFGYET